MLTELGNGLYDIQIQALHQKKNEPSAMSPYLNEKAIVEKDGENVFLAIIILDHETVTGFQVERNGTLTESIAKQIDEASNRRIETFKISHLSTFLNARVQYAVVHEGQEIKGDEPLRLSFNETTLQK